MKVVAILLLAGLAQAEEEDLMIKMPEAVTQTIIKAGEKPQADLALVQVETNQQLGMFESGVLHASLKPIVKAKVKKVMNFIHDTKDEYEHGTEDQKKSIRDKATSLVMMDAGTRGYNGELCIDLWNEATEVAGALSHFYCPGLVFPDSGFFSYQMPQYKSVQGSGPSRLRSAWLSFIFLKDLISYSSEAAILDFLADDVSYYWGRGDGLLGKAKVGKTLPYIGFPEDTWIHSPVEWHCDMTSCLAPVTAWSHQENYILTTFGGGGLLSEIIIPLYIWR
jgi:hypothetical protein